MRKLFFLRRGEFFLFFGRGWPFSRSNEVNPRQEFLHIGKGILGLYHVGVKASDQLVHVEHLAPIEPDSLFRVYSIAS